MSKTRRGEVRYAVVAARYNARGTDGLLSGCLASLKAAGVGADRIRVVRVPGSFELPLAAQALAKTGRYGAVICLGALIRGETDHFDLVAGECARGIARVSLETGIPVIFGVVAAHTPAQAAVRCAWPSTPRRRQGKGIRNRGQEAAEAAVEMASLQAIAHGR